MLFSMRQPYMPAGDAPVQARNLVDVQGAAADAIRQLVDRAPLDCRLLEDLDLETGYENWIEHGLGRTVRGVYVVYSTTPSLQWYLEDSDADLALYAPLGTTDDTTIGLVVF